MGKKGKTTVYPDMPAYRRVVLCLWIFTVGLQILYGPSPACAQSLWLTAVLLEAARSDCRNGTIPMALVGRGLGGWPLVIGNIGWRPALCRAMEGAAALGLLLAVTVLGERLFKKRLLGGGDIRLVGLIGLWLGWRGCWLWRNAVFENAGPSDGDRRWPPEPCFISYFFQIDEVDEFGNGTNR